MPTATQQLEAMTYNTVLHTVEADINSLISSIRLNEWLRDQATAHGDTLTAQQAEMQIAADKASTVQFIMDLVYPPPGIVTM